MKTLTLTLLFCLFATAMYGNETDLAVEAENRFHHGEYHEGLAILTQAYGDPSLTLDQQAALLQAFARFYEHLVGNHAMAVTFYTKILNLNLPQQHPLRQSAFQEEHRLRALEEAYADQDHVLRELQSTREALEAYEIEEQIAVLQTLLDEYPDYYKRPEALYTLGLNYLAQKNYREAIASFKDALELKPAIDIYYLAVTPRIGIAYKEWIRSIAHRAAWGTLTVLGIASMVLFYAARPWRWVRWQDIATGIVLMAGWWGLFKLVSLWLSRNFTIPGRAIEVIRTQLPSLVRAVSGSPGAAILHTLFWYSLIGLGGTFIFAIGISRLKWRWAAYFLNAIVGFLFVTALLTVFYLRYCYDQGEFIAETNQGFQRYLNGAVYLHPINPAPYILTNPAAYTDLEIMDLTQADFGAAGDEQSDLLQWIIKHVD